MKTRLRRRGGKWVGLHQPRGPGLFHGRFHFAAVIGEELFVADAPNLTARCSRDGKTPGMCLSERRIDGTDLTFRFPRSWLAQWRDVANAMDRLAVQLHGPGG